MARIPQGYLRGITNNCIVSSLALAPQAALITRLAIDEAACEIAIPINQNVFLKINVRLIPIATCSRMLARWFVARNW